MCFGLETLTLGQQLMGGATLFSAGTKIMAGEGAQSGYERQAAQAREDARAEREAAREQAERIRRQGRATAGAATAGFAGAGVSVDSGTARVIGQEIGERSEEDAAQAILYGNRRAKRFETEAQALQMAGSNAAVQGYLGATSSILSGGAMLAGGWKTPNRALVIDE